MSDYWLSYICKISFNEPHIPPISIFTILYTILIAQSKCRLHNHFHNYGGDIFDASILQMAIRRPLREYMAGYGCDSSTCRPSQERSRSMLPIFDELRLCGKSTKYQAYI